MVPMCSIEEHVGGCMHARGMEWLLICLNLWQRPWCMQAWVWILALESAGRRALFDMWRFAEIAGDSGLGVEAQGQQGRAR